MRDGRRSDSAQHLKAKQNEARSELEKSDGIAIHQAMMAQSKDNGKTAMPRYIQIL
jgi:hypothetical protein